MTTLTYDKVTDQLAMLSRKWVLYLSHSACDDFDELCQAVPFLDPQTVIDLIGSCLWITYDDGDAAFAAFKQVIGDDGPTASNPYNGPARVFAYLAGPHGGITVNT